MMSSKQLKRLDYGNLPHPDLPFESASGTAAADDSTFSFLDWDLDSAFFFFETGASSAWSSSSSSASGLDFVPCQIDPHHPVAHQSTKPPSLRSTTPPPTFFLASSFNFAFLLFLSFLALSSLFLFPPVSSSSNSSCSASPSSSASIFSASILLASFSAIQESGFEATR